MWQEIFPGNSIKQMNMPIKLYLCSRRLYRKRIGKVVAKVIWRINRIIFSCEIDPSANVHPSVKTPHNMLGCVIGSDVVIGENTKILHNVTIGGRGGAPEMPIIGKNVLIGTGAVILGGVVIGDNSKIGANAVVLNNVPPNSTVVGVPAKLISQEPE